MYYMISYYYDSRLIRNGECYLYKCNWRGKKYVRKFKNVQLALEYLRKIKCDVTVYPPRGDAIDIWEDWPTEYRLPKCE